VAYSLLNSEIESEHNKYKILPSHKTTGYTLTSQSGDGMKEKEESGKGKHHHKKRRAEPKLKWLASEMFRLDSDLQSLLLLLLQKEERRKSKLSAPRYKYTPQAK
jgi:hypothetical protein